MLLGTFFTFAAIQTLTTEDSGVGDDCIIVQVG